MNTFVNSFSFYLPTAYLPKRLYKMIQILTVFDQDPIRQIREAIRRPDATRFASREPASSFSSVRSTRREVLVG